MTALPSSSDNDLRGILAALEKIQVDHSHLASSVEDIKEKVEFLASHGDVPEHDANDEVQESIAFENPESGSAPTPGGTYTPRKASGTSRIILTTYPGQSGINPIVMDWGNPDPIKRGPVVVSRHPNTVKKRNGQLVTFLTRMSE